MSRVIVGYGEYNGFGLKELPSAVLEDLGSRYPLRIDEHFPSEYEELYITVAVHGELGRRRAGGKQEPRVQTLRELAVEIVTRGYQKASKDHHPDGKGHHEAQIRLTKARDELHAACINLSDEVNDEGMIVIPAPAARVSKGWKSSSVGISDDDVPF